MQAVLMAARDSGNVPVLLTPENAAATYGAGYLAALQNRGRAEFPDVAFTLVVDCGDTPGYALACLRAGIARITESSSADTRMVLRASFVQQVRLMAQVSPGFR